MYQSPRSYHKAYSAHRSHALNVVADYHFHAPAVFAARERLATHLARHRIEQADPRSGVARPGIVRRWLGEQLVRFGARVGGVPVPAASGASAGD